MAKQKGTPLDQGELNQQEEQFLEKIVEDSMQILLRIRENRGIINRIFHNIRNFFTAGPRREVYHDWLFAFSFYYKTIKSFCEREKHETSVEVRSTLATVLAYLILAKSERDFAYAWSYVNLAITHLSLVVEEEDLESFTPFLKGEYRRSPDNKKDESKVRMGKEERKEEKKPSQSGEDSEGFYGTVEPLDRNQIHSGLLKESHRWNEINCQTSFKLSLLKSVGAWLFFSLVATIFISEQISRIFQPNVIFRNQYMMIAILGFFGGGLSAFFTARKAVINLTNSAMVRLLTILRMLLGAAGSFVVYVILQWQPLKEISVALSNNHAAYITIGIVAGFSERLFIASLARITGDFTENDRKNQ